MTNWLIIGIGLLFVAVVVNHVTKRSVAENSIDTTQLGSGEMFNTIAPYYDVANRFMSLGNDKEWRRTMISRMKIENGYRILDLATGTGEVVFEMNRYIQKHGKQNVKITGVDPSNQMLRIAEMKAITAISNNNINFEIGDAEKLNYSSNTFDKLSMSFGIRNVLNRIEALKEIRRVVMDVSLDTDNKEVIPKLVIMEFLRPTKGFMSTIANGFLQYVLPYIGTIISRGKSAEYNHLRDSIFRFPSVENFLKELNEVGFHHCVAEDIFFDIVYLFICY